MLRTSLKSLLGRKLRLLLSAVAIVLGVAFVAGTLIFTDTLGRTFDRIMVGSVGDVVVRPVPAPGQNMFGVSGAQLDAALLQRLSTVPGVARVDGNVTDLQTYVIDAKGKVMGSSGGAPAMGVNWNDAPAMGGQHSIVLKSGRPPAAAGEIALDTITLDRSGYRVGDTVRLATSGEHGTFPATLVGSFEFGGGGLAGASIVAFTTERAQQLYTEGRDVYHDAWVSLAPGADAATVAAAAGAQLPSGLQAVTGQSVADENSKSVAEGMGFITTFLLVFAGVALVVGTFLIVNTFSILVAQRSRELALLRALGASRRQVRRSVLLEALVVGLVGATLGLLAGIGLAQLIGVLMSGIGLDMTGSGLLVTPRTVLVAYAIGVLVTLVAGWLPARRASALPPVAAMSDEVQLPEGSLGRRAAAAAVLTVVGVVALLVGAFLDVPGRLALVGGGILLTMLGVAAASPVLGRPLLDAVGAAYGRLYGVVGRLASDNAVRNPRRTAATASALMIGLALVTMMSVLGRSTEVSLDGMLRTNVSGDYQVLSPVRTSFPPAIAEQVAATPGSPASAGCATPRPSTPGRDCSWPPSTRPSDRP